MLNSNNKYYALNPLNRNSRRFIIITVAGIMLICSKSHAQDYEQAQNRVKSIYLYNFIKDIQWPNLSAKEIKICLFQKNGFYVELDKLIASKKINDKILTVNQVPSLSECVRCDLVFIDETSNAGLKRDANCTSLIVTCGFYEQSISNIVL